MDNQKTQDGVVVESTPLLAAWGCEGRGSFDMTCRRRGDCLHRMAFDKHVDREHRRDFPYAVCKCDFTHGKDYEYFTQANK